jgi:V8-like Glu-specific endopeptidase
MKLGAPKGTSRRSVVVSGALCAFPFPFLPDLREQLQFDLPRWKRVERVTAPYNMIGTFAAWRGSDIGTPFGTVWMCGPGRVATAAHVVREALDYTGTAPMQIRFGCVSAASLGNASPRINKDQLELYRRDSQDEDQFDVGRILIEGVSAGLLPASVPGEKDFHNIEVAGYPADYHYGGVHYDGRVLVSHSSDVASRPDRHAAFLLYAADTAGGQSGSPVMRRNQSGVWEAIAIHVGGNDLLGVVGLNKGVWIDETITRFLRG